MNLDWQYQLFNQQVIDLEDRIIQLEQILIQLEQYYFFSLQKMTDNQLLTDYKLVIKQQEIAIKKLEIEHQLAVEKLEFALLTM